MADGPNEEIQRLTDLLKRKDRQIERMREGHEYQEEVQPSDEEKKWLTWLTSKEPFIIKKREIAAL